MRRVRELTPWVSGFSGVIDNRRYSACLTAPSQRHRPISLEIFTLPLRSAAGPSTPTLTESPQLTLATKSVTRVPRSQVDPSWRPLCTHHPAFGVQQVYIPLNQQRRRKRPLLSTAHPAFGDPVVEESQSNAVGSSLQQGELASAVKKKEFKGAVTVGGFFLAIDPHLSLLRRKDCMNPNAQLTIRDSEGHMSRIRYKCLLESSAGFKIEAIVRFQVGWLSPHCKFSEMPQVIHLGKGFDISLPFLFHFTMVDVLDEHGNETGSVLYFSGTPFIGVSFGFSRISKGRLVLNLEPGRKLDLERDSKQFVGSQHHKVHKRQLGFVAFKTFSWVFCALLCVPYFDVWAKCRSFIQSYTPQPLRPVLHWVLPPPHSC